MKRTLQQARKKSADHSCSIARALSPSNKPALYAGGGTPKDGPAPSRWALRGLAGGRVSTMAKRSGVAGVTARMTERRAAKDTPERSIGRRSSPARARQRYGQESCGVTVKDMSNTHHRHRRNRPNTSVLHVAKRSIGRAVSGSKQREINVVAIDSDRHNAGNLSDCRAI